MRLLCECSTALVGTLCPRCDAVRLANRAAASERLRQREEARQAVRFDIDRERMIEAAHRVDPRQARAGAKARERVARGAARARAR